MEQNAAVHRKDAYGCTPLHVAALAHRRDLVHLFLRDGVRVEGHTQMSRAVGQLCCGDPALEKSLLSLDASRVSRGKSPPKPKLLQRASSESEEKWLQPTAQQVPRSPIIEESPASIASMVRLAVAIFNRCAGDGIAFMVATGAVMDYAQDICAFLKRHGDDVDSSQLASFLGESNSIASMLRFEYFNAISLRDAGILGSLRRALSPLRLPPDLTKIDRLVQSLASAWWQQRRLLVGRRKYYVPTDDTEEFGTGAIDDDGSGRAAREGTGGLETSRADVDELQEHAVSATALYQVMFSTLMLHWVAHSSHSDGKTLPTVSLEQWLELNHNVDMDRLLPVPMLERLYASVHRTLIPSLLIPSGRMSSMVETKPMEHPLRAMANAEGWVWILHAHCAGSAVGGELIAPTSLFGQASLSRRFGAVPGQSPTVSRSSERTAGPIATMVGSHVHWDADNFTDRVWMSLWQSLLLFSPSPSDQDVPFAFASLRHVLLERSDPDDSMLVLVHNPEAGLGLFDDDVAKETSDGKSEGSPSRRAMSNSRFTLVFLQQDGSWKEFPLTKLEIQLGSERDVEHWSMHLRDVCGEVFWGPGC
mmetsp:Transcript_49968/g.112485  ORF Transcript_49968/g.112485 Transcript_49968/m.112485 type:complete len:590 (-) Transcript_49968:25-1794(-)